MARRRYRAAYRLGVLAAGCLLGIVLSSQMTSADGISGCMHRALLSSHRTALIGPWMASPVPIRATPRASANAVAKLAARVRVAVRSCDGTWCNVEVTGHDVGGFVRQSALSGVYPNEKIM
jgi:SH3-like domain-containing protein